MKTQTRTSASTSINARKLPAVYGRFSFAPGETVMDYGCGRYTDHIRAALEGVDYIPYDPYNQPEPVNAESLRTLASHIESRSPLTVICSNVLNVIDSEGAIQAIADKLLFIAEATGGRALVTVYEGDRSGTGRETGPDQWQRNEKLRDYLRFFPAGRATVHRNTIVIK